MRLQVRVHPRAGKTEVVGFKDGVLYVRVTAPPEKGKANEAVVELLAKVLRVPKSAIRVIQGETARGKVLDIEGLTDQEVRGRLG